MSATHDPQLLKGVLSLLLIGLLDEHESYGYEVVQRLQAAGLSGINEGSVYPALARLDREGKVDSRLVASRTGPARKYYRPTAEGVAALTSGTASWHSLVELVNPILARRAARQPIPAEEALR